MEFFQTAWRDGSTFNHGLSTEEYFYAQIYKAVEKNVENKNLPFFNTTNFPMEVTTGKIINDENLIALEQMAAKQGYKSNMWIYGDTLEKLQKEGIKLNLKQGAEPVLCLTKFANANHIKENELYISENGSKAKAQFLYNYDSLDDRSKQQIQDHYSTTFENGRIYEAENHKNFSENIKNGNKSPLLNTLKNNLKGQCEKAQETYAKASPASSRVDFSALINAQARHCCQSACGGKITNTINPQVKQNCYELLGTIFEESKVNGSKPWKVGEAITRALDAGTRYAKSYTAKDFNLEVRKTREEMNEKNK